MFSVWVIDLLKEWGFCFRCVMALSPWPVVLCKPLALWLSAIYYSVIWQRAPESPLGPLLHPCSLIKVQGLVSADNPVRLAFNCRAHDPGISSQFSDWFQGKAKQNTGQSVDVYSGVLCHDCLFYPINLMLLAMYQSLSISTEVQNLSFICE